MKSNKYPFLRAELGLAPLEPVLEMPKSIKDRKKKKAKYSPDSSRFQKFGLDKEDYLQMVKAQNECCKICKRHRSTLSYPLYVDHCHETQKIRGLLCNRCNSLLGNAQDKIETLRAAVNYLEQH